MPEKVTVFLVAMSLSFKKRNMCNFSNVCPALKYFYFSEQLGNRQESATIQASNNKADSSMTNTFQSTETNYEMQQTTHTTSSVQVSGTVRILNRRVSNLFKERK